MILTDFHIFTYQLPIISPLQIGNNILTSREGVIIHLTTDTDIQGFGETAPLPGLQLETLNDVKKQLWDIKSLFKGVQIQDGFAVLEKQNTKNYMFSSVQFALESALLNVIEQVKNLGLSFKLPKVENDKINVNILATGSKTQILKKVEQGLLENCRSIKVKVGRNSLEEEIELVRAIDKLFGTKISLRLDANQAWEFEQAVAFAEAVKDITIEYIEEPLKNPKKLQTLQGKTNLPIALDESLQEISPDNLQSLEWVNTLILKPAVIGSVIKTVRYITQAKEMGIKSIISDTFHTGIGLSMLIRLASIIDEPLPMGFDTYNWLGEDILVDRLTKTGGYFDLKTVLDRGQNVDFTKLEKIG